MNKMIPFVLLASAAVPGRAADFDRGMDVAAMIRQARAADMPAPAARAEASAAWTAPAPEISSQRVTELIVRSSEWRARKEDMRLALNAFYGNIVARRGYRSEWKKIVLQIWDMASEVESAEGAVADRFSSRINAEEADPDERARRLAAVATIRDFRRFVLYGNVIPRVIDESDENDQGLYDGRLYAGPTWGMAMSWDESEAANKTLVAMTGFTAEEYKAAGTAAYAEYKAAHPDAL